MRIYIPYHIDESFGCHANIFVFIIIIARKVLDGVFIHEIGQLIIDLSDCVEADGHGEFTAAIIDEFLYDVLDDGLDLVIRD